MTSVKLPGLPLPLPSSCECTFQRLRSKVRVHSLGGDKVKQAVLVSVQVPKGVGCQAGNKAKAQNVGGTHRPGAKVKPDLSSVQLPGAPRGLRFFSGAAGLSCR